MGVLASRDAVEHGLRVASYMLTRLHNKCLRRHSRPLAGARTARSSGVLVLITRGKRAAGLEVVGAGPGTRVPGHCLLAGFCGVERLKM